MSDKPSPPTTDELSPMLKAALQWCGALTPAEIEAVRRELVAKLADHLAPQLAPHGCICPAGAEATCKGLFCPRRAIDYSKVQAT